MFAEIAATLTTLVALFTITASIGITRDLTPCFMIVDSFKKKIPRGYGMRLWIQPDRDSSCPHESGERFSWSKPVLSLSNGIIDE